YMALVIGGGVLLAAAALTLRGTMRPLVALLGLLVTMHVVDVVTGGHLQINTVFGYSPTVGGRFAGFGNLTHAQVPAAAVLLAGLLDHLLGGRRGLTAAVAVLAVALLADGLPFWGSDVGGVLASVPAFALVVLGLSGIRISRRRRRPPSLPSGSSTCCGRPASGRISAASSSKSATRDSGRSATPSSASSARTCRCSRRRSGSRSCRRCWPSSPG